MTPFDLHTPSYFSINSPFQAICAIATIKQLEIEDYRIIVCVRQKNDPRGSQLYSVLDFFGMQYRVVGPLGRTIERLYMIRSLLHRHNRYQRLFLGDYRNISSFIIGCCFISDKSDVICLDDGNFTISLLNDILPEPLLPKTIKLLNLISRRRKIVHGQNLLTIYSDITNPKYQIANLDLSMILSQREMSISETKGIYIVGTNIERYCIPLEMSKEVFIDVLDELVCKLRKENPNESIVYIPHGRDVSMYAEHICKKYDCEFRRVEMTVEMELLREHNYPKAVFGFTSSALYNIKKMFPKTEVINIFLDVSWDNLVCKGRKLTSDYYVKNGIELQVKQIDR